MLPREAERSLWLHRALVGRLAVEPEVVLSIGRVNLERWRQLHVRRGMTSRRLQDWADVMDAGVDAVADVFTSPSDAAVELRQNSPFAGALTPGERTRVLAEFRRHWRAEHQPAHVDETTPARSSERSRVLDRARAPRHHDR